MYLQAQLYQQRLLCPLMSRLPDRFVLINKREYNGTKRKKEIHSKALIKLPTYTFLVGIAAMRHKKEFCVIACENMITNCTGKVHIYFILCVMVVQMFHFAFVSAQLFYYYYSAYIASPTYLPYVRSLTLLC